MCYHIVITSHRHVPQEFNDKCDELAAALRKQGLETKAVFVERKKEEKDGYFNFTMVMMNGQLATGIIEQVWGKLKKGGMNCHVLSHSK